MKNFFVTTQNFSSWCHLDHHVDVDVGVMTHLGSTCRWPGWHPGGVRTTRWSSGDHQVDIPDTNPVSNPGCPDPGCRIPGSRSGIPESRIGIPDPGIRDPDPRSEVGPGYPPNPQFDHLVGGGKVGGWRGGQIAVFAKKRKFGQICVFPEKRDFSWSGTGKIVNLGLGYLGGSNLPNFAKFAKFAKFCEICVFGPSKNANTRCESAPGTLQNPGTKSTRSAYLAIQKCQTLQFNQSLIKRAKWILRG